MDHFDAAIKKITAINLTLLLYFFFQIYARGFTVLFGSIFAKAPIQDKPVSEKSADYNTIKLK